MVAVERTEAVAGVGITNDRYACGAGFWQDARVSRDLTLVESEVVDDLRSSGVPLGAGELRRNVTTRGITLNELVGRSFWVGDALARGTQLCEPCRHLEQVTGKDLLRRLVHRGGLRAAVLTTGAIRTGDAIEAAEERDGVGVIAVRDGRVLLGRRLAAHGYGTWSFPGGKPHPGESALECAVRELREETTLVARGGSVLTETIDGFPETRDVYRTQFVRVAELSGRPRRSEPDKVEEWRWYPWQSLPEPLFGPVASFLRVVGEVG